MSVTSEIEQLLAQYRACWGARDFEALGRLWDRDDPDPVYVAEEAPAPMTSHDAIDRYWAMTKSITTRIALRTWNLNVKELADDIAAAAYEMHWDIELADETGTKIGGDVRVSAIFRRTHDDWEFVHYVEGPLAAAVQIRRFNANNVTEGF